MRRLLFVCLFALCVPALALADGHPRAKTVTGTVGAPQSGVISVTSGGGTLTCVVPSRAAASVAKLQAGSKVRITCRPAAGGSLVLSELHPLPSHDPGKHDSGSGTSGPGSNSGTGSNSGSGDSGNTGSGDTGTGDGDHGSGSGGATTPAPTPPPPPPPAQHRDLVGIVFFLSPTGMAVRPDAGGDVLTCAITPAPDSQAAAAKLTLNGHFAITCRLDGTRWVLSGATPRT
jgi:hypothetical protein